MFKLPYALPLNFIRTWGARSSRAGDAQEPRHRPQSRTRTRSVHDHGPATQSCGHGLSVSANSPRSCPVPGNGRVHGKAVDSPWQRTRLIHRQSADTVCPRPRSGRGHGLSVAQVWPMNVRAVATHVRAVINAIPDQVQPMAASCPHLIPLKSARRSRNLLRAGRRNSTNCSLQKTSSSN